MLDAIQIKHTIERKETSYSLIVLDKRIVYHFKLHFTIEAQGLEFSKLNAIDAITIIHSKCMLLL